MLVHDLDGFWASLPLEGALASDVFLADELEGEPLSVDHWAPLRLVAQFTTPTRVSSTVDYRALPQSTHGCTAMADATPGTRRPGGEDRLLPGRIIRPIFRAGLPMLRHKVSQAYERAERSDQGG